MQRCPPPPSSLPPSLSLVAVSRATTPSCAGGSRTTGMAAMADERLSRRDGGRFSSGLLRRVRVPPQPATVRVPQTSLPPASGAGCSGWTRFVLLAGGHVPKSKPPLPPGGRHRVRANSLTAALTIMSLERHPGR